MNKKEKQIVINESMSLGKDEIYTTLYECPNCKKIVCADYNFCPHCGVKIMWE